MKKIFFALSLFICLIGMPLTLLAKVTTPTLTLNNLQYKPQYEPLIINHTLYVSGYDLADMTYGTYVQTADTAVLTIQNKTYTYSLLEHTGLLDHLKYVPNNKPYISDDNTIFYPITLLDDLNYEYILEDYHLSIIPLMPYSTSTDQPKYHQTLPTHFTSYSDLLSSLLSSDEIDQLILDAKQEHNYISLISLNYKADCIKFMKALAKDAPDTTVYLRKIDLSGTAPILSDFTTLPLTYRFDNDLLSLQLGNKKLTSTCFWAAYNPYAANTDIDINKSLDVMLMRTLYEYYRDTYHIKDNLNLSPIIKVTNARSDYMCCDVYFDSDSSQKTYEIILYKQSTATTVHYYIDLVGCF